MYEVWQFDNISQYDPETRKGGVVTEYVNTFLKLKQEASGWSEWCQCEKDRQLYITDYHRKEGICLAASKIKWNP